MAAEKTRRLRILLGLMTGLGLMAVGAYMGIPPDDSASPTNPVISQASGDALAETAP